MASPMDIYYLGHSSFRIVGKDVTIVTDPFDPKMVGLKFPKVSADITTISHDHGDHNAIDQMEAAGMIITGPGEYEIKKVSIFGFPSFHDDKKGQERGKNTMYLIEFEDLRIVHLGDLGHKLSETDIDAMGEVDILMIPVGGNFTIDHKIAADTVHAIEPKIILPMHYKTDGLNPETFAELEGPEPFISELGFKKENQKKLTVKQASLNPEEQVIILLETK
jgi:L-ascorbate metabolism protein UlaG (beta-lactamase superfamily)